MSDYLIDADYVINALKGKAHTTETITRLASDGIAISVVTVAELYEGAFWTTDPQRHLASLRGFLASFEMLGLDDPILERFAKVRADLRNRGELIPDIDIFMGVTAVRHGLTLLTGNVRHLRRIPGIKLYDQAQPARGGEQL